MRSKIFVPVIGQYENVGDIILRRPLVDWLRGTGSELHLYSGKAPEGYLKGLNVRPEDVVYQSYLSWYLAALKCALGGNAHYAFKPGEIQLSLAGLKEHLSILPLIGLIRLRGGKVIRIGSGARNFSPFPRALMKPSVCLSQLVFWRDSKTTAYMGQGDTMPDLAFAEGEPVEEFSASRDVLIVSMRGDREHSGTDWIQAVREYATSKGLKIWVVTQVLRDSDLSQRLAVDLGADILDWDGESHDRQEVQLRELYRHADMVVSDRLHVLIAAYTHGAIPVGMLAYPSDKIKRHFEAAGVEGISIFTRNKSAQAILEEMQIIAARRQAIRAVLTVARQKLEAVRARMVQVLAATK